MKGSLPAALSELCGRDERHYKSKRTRPFVCEQKRRGDGVQARFKRGRMTL